ncbi:MazG-like family protein [Rahnella sp. FC061912-K]|uniref:MazG-like family protein n=1 Tax=Rahnella rivi TaxID=2816249 RepID=UPI001C2588F4|nr:MazG-like family protein [Rahnella rivi]MBU9829864.1 MazG-like family protein [Rahnella rivi]
MTKLSVIRSIHETRSALASVISEMDKQDSKWGLDRDQHPYVWQTILTEEVGELAQAILHDDFGGSHAGTARGEAVQIAAVALQIIEYYDRIEGGRNDNTVA